eukprot:scaffold516_cov401-Prasinococcus_capsulatus_cf.AAC.22
MRGGTRGALHAARTGRVWSRLENKRGAKRARDARTRALVWLPSPPLGMHRTTVNEAALYYSPRWPQQCRSWPGV